ncbi:MAG: hypothetical protein QNJ07_13455 [Woeseiaceae bacterium]|nr:hypothetical protein [Woeseiaceae bacterium]
MATPDLPQRRSPGQSNDDPSAARIPQRSRLEETLVKSSIWKRKTLRDIEYNRALAASESDDEGMQTARLIFRLSAQLDERNDEIERLRLAVSKLETEKSRLSLEHRQELESQQAELERLQGAYDQFEKESDSLLSELGQQNERLLHECRNQNPRSLLK